MESMKKIPVMLTIRGEQHYRGQEPDMVELMTEGELEETPEGWRICYLESDLTGLEGATTTFDIRPGYVVLSRTGARKIHVNLGPLGGNLDVFYSIEVEQTMAGTVRYQIAVRPV